MSIKYIEISKAKVHNLKNISLKIPRDQLIVITGPSGSGKSSLAFDTLYAEGQRRYIESLSSYARQFLGQINPPDVESITGLSPAIAIDQKSNSRNPRSTVGTITEIYDYLRVLFARVGTPHCPETGNALTSQSAQQIINTISKFHIGTKIQILSPIIKNSKGSHKELFSKWQSLGYARARINGEITNISDDIKLNKNNRHNIDLIIDRIVIKDNIIQRLTDSVEIALKLSEGHLICLADDKEYYFSENYYSHKTGISYPSLEPRLFSFNSPIGACQECNGLGEIQNFDEKTLIFDKSLNILEGAIPVLAKKSGFLHGMVASLLEEEKSLKVPLCDISTDIYNTLFFGSDKIYNYKFKSENSSFNFKKEFPGLINYLHKKYMESTSEKVRKDLEQYMHIIQCKKCNGERLNTYALSVRIGEKNISEISKMTLEEAQNFFQSLDLISQNKIIADKLLKEITARLNFLCDVGVNYLSLNRSANTLSGGESQRIRLATQIGSMLSGVLYVLDEPSIGLHSRDNDRLISTLKKLRDNGNTVIVVEHDEETMLSSDHIIDIGPGAGIHGGEIVFQGTPKELLNNSSSLTAQYLNSSKTTKITKTKKSTNDLLELYEANHHNLKNITVKIPLSMLVCVTGVSGSGKSTLIHKVLVPAIKHKLGGPHSALYEYNNYKALTGIKAIKSIIELDQSPIGRTPKSNPATYTGLFDLIRDLFSKTNDSKIRGYKAGRFSFNLKGGRCETCEGNGTIKIEMHFLPDVYIECSECRGKRYNNETLNILYKGKNIYDVLEMSVEEAFEFFSNHPKMKKILETLNSIGLGYMKIGQPATTLSGGEAQRLKLSKELSKSTKGHCLYVLDEPTTGLHFKDIDLLLIAIQKLIKNNNTVLVIEHNMDVIKTADYIIDLGPEGGKNGGQLVFQGSASDIINCKESLTGKFLKKHFK